jgi:mono/diheme cytochrome c family protein
MIHGWRMMFAACALAGVGCSGQPHGATPLGVYTTEQAARGKDVYAGMCLSCHAGMGNHTGPVFRARWGGRDVQQLYGFISENMPKNDPGTLSPDEYAAVVAYLLQLNGIPAGSTPLPIDTMQLKAITIDTLVSKR